MLNPILFGKVQIKNHHGTCSAFLHHGSYPVILKHVFLRMKYLCEVPIGKSENIKYLNYYFCIFTYIIDIKNSKLNFSRIIRI